MLGSAAATPLSLGRLLTGSVVTPSGTGRAGWFWGPDVRTDWAAGAAAVGRELCAGPGDCGGDDVGAPGVVRATDDAGVIDIRGAAAPGPAAATAGAADWPTKPPGPALPGEGATLAATRPEAGEAGAWLASEARRFPA